MEKALVIDPVEKTLRVIDLPEPVGMDGAEAVGMRMAAVLEGCDEKSFQQAAAVFGQETAIEVAAFWVLKKLPRRAVLFTSELECD